MKKDVTNHQVAGRRKDIAFDITDEIKSKL